MTFEGSNTGVHAIYNTDIELLQGTAILSDFKIVTV